MTRRIGILRAIGAIAGLGFVHTTAVAQEIKLTFADQNSATG